MTDPTTDLNIDDDIMMEEPTIEGTSTGEPNDYDLTYEAHSKCRAGRPIENIPQVKEPEKSWAPFIDEEEFHFAKWFLDAGVSKNDIDDYLGGPFGEKCRGNTRFKNAQNMFDVIDKIQHDYNVEDWKAQDIPVEIDGKTRIFTIYFRNPMECIKCMLGHHPFQYDLAYQQVQRYRDGKRMYNEIYTSD